MLRTLLVLLLLTPQKGAIVVAPGPQEPEKTEPFVAPFTPMPEPPELPKVDLNSCPFEGCQFGKWTALNPVEVFSSWRADRKQITRLHRDEVVTALTGVTIVLAPGKGIFTRDVPMLGAKAGDKLYSYQACGEGAEDIWVHGRFIKCADPNFSWKPGLGCDKDCNGRYLGQIGVVGGDSIGRRAHGMGISGRQFRWSGRPRLTSPFSSRKRRQIARFTYNA